MYRHKLFEAICKEEDLTLRDLVKDFVDDEIMPVRQQIDDDDEHEIIHELLQGLANLGFLRAIFPEKYGGSDMRSVVSLVLSLEEVARGDSGIAVALSCCLWPFIPAIWANNEAVLDYFGPMFCGDDLKLGCFNMTEPGGPSGGGGCDIENYHLQGRKINTRAVLDGDKWVLNGQKIWASNSGVADAYCMVCTTDPNLGDEGIALIYVPGDVEGLSFGKFENKAGMAADRNTTTYLENVRVPKEFRLAGPGEDAKYFHANLTVGRIGSAAMSVGNAQGAFEAVLDFTGDRAVGVTTKSIRDHSIAAGMLADMAIGIETARITYLSSAYRFDHPEEYGEIYSLDQLSYGSIAKVYAADMAVSVTNRAMELMGSYGYVRDCNVEKYWRDCKITQLWEGGAQLGRFDVCRAYWDLPL
ncbi:MAG: acyl-CoA dehydrogenase family protein [Dehalococcoidia bacterium]|nr:MAG: acyl-CoA dehydrogenase family protein [Dehalococcoidia bacterium]